MTFEHFTPRISAENDPSGPGRKLWCWHLPGGEREFHGTVKQIALMRSRMDYIAFLKERFNVDVKAADVECDESGAPATVHVHQPLITPAVEKRVSAKPPDIIRSDCKTTSTPFQLFENLTVSKLIPILATIPYGEPVQIRVPEPKGWESFRGNLRTRLKKEDATSNFTWRTDVPYPGDPRYVPGDIRTLYVTKLKADPKPIPQPEITATQRVEERIETRTTETTVKVSTPAPLEPPAVPVPAIVVEPETVPVPQVSSAPVDAPAATLQSGILKRPSSYLPDDGQAAKQVLDLHERLTISSPDSREFESLMDRLWNAASGVWQYREAKRITDAAIGPWIEDFLKDIGDGEDALADLWPTLAERVHEAVLGIIVSQQDKSNQRHEKDQEALRKARTELQTLKDQVHKCKTCTPF